MGTPDYFKSCFFFLSFLKYSLIGVPAVAQPVKNSTGIHENVVWIPGIDHWVKDPVLPQALAEAVT